MHQNLTNPIRLLLTTLFVCVGVWASAGGGASDDYTLHSTKKDESESVKDYHNFLVGESGIVVHNACNKALVKEFVDKPGNIAKLPRGPKKSALQELKRLKDSAPAKFQKFKQDFPNGIPLEIGEGGVKAWKKVFKEGDAVSDILRKDIPTLEWLAKHGDDIPQSTADDLLAAIDKPIKETLEDAQGRLTYVLDRPGQSNKVVSVHPTSSGQFKTTTYNPAYNPNLNPNIDVPLSANKLVPDYINTPYMHPLQGTTVVKIKLSGNRSTDFARARAELGISSADETVNGVNHTWHHMDDFEIIDGEAYATMQLVQSAAHQGTGVTGMQHSGCVAQWRAFFGFGY